MRNIAPLAVIPFLGACTILDGAVERRTPYAAPPTGFADRLLEAHNDERKRAGVAPLRWDVRLADRAAAYATQLVDLGKLEHSPAAERRGEGENLWMGTAQAFAPEAMVEGWTEERQYFKAGRFPAVSNTGNWHDVGHYTQLIWSGTQSVGCGLAGDAKWEYLVCRYAPAGNVIGRTVP